MCVKSLGSVVFRRPGPFFFPVFPVSFPRTFVRPTLVGTSTIFAQRRVAPSCVPPIKQNPGTTVHAHGPPQGRYYTRWGSCQLPDRYGAA